MYGTFKNTASRERSISRNKQRKEEKWRETFAKESGSVELENNIEERTKKGENAHDRGLQGARQQEHIQ